MVGEGFLKRHPLVIGCGRATGARVIHRGNGHASLRRVGRRIVRIIRQAVARLTPGDVQESVPKRVKPPAGEVYMRTECPRGELGYYIVSDGTTRPYRLKVKSPCFTVMSAFREVSRGAMIADIVAILGSFDIVLGEIDR